MQNYFNKIHNTHLFIYLFVNYFNRTNSHITMYNKKDIPCKSEYCFTRTRKKKSINVRK